MNKRRAFQRVLGLAFIILVALCSFKMAYAVSIIPDYLEESLMKREGFTTLLRSGQFRQAKEAAEAKLKSDPNSPALWLILGYAEAGLKNWEAAVNSVKQAIDHAPKGKKVELQVDLGNIYILQGNDKEAQRIYQEVLAQRPESPRALYSLGLLLHQSGEKKKAFAQYKKVLKLNPQHQKSIKAMIQIRVEEGRYEEVIPLARQLQQVDPNQELGYYFEAVALARKANPNYQASIPLLQKALEKNPTSKQTLYTLGFVYLKSGQDGEALSRLKEAIRLDPDFFEAYKLLVNIALKQNDFAAAAGHLEKALSLRESSELYQLLGKVYLRLGKKEAGLDALTQSLQGASLEEGELLAAEGLYEYVGGDLEESERTLKRALKQDPKMFETRILLIVNMLNQGRYQDAITEAQEGVTQHPEDQMLLLNLLAQAYLGEGMVGEAEQALLKALKKDPDFLLTHLNLSAVYFKQGLYDKTEEELEQILKRDPEHLQAKILLGRVYQARSENQKAEQLLRSLLDSEPSNTALLKEMILLQERISRFDQALDYTDKLISLFPESILGYVLKSLVYESMGNLPLALNAIETGLRKAGESRAALASGATLAFANGQYEKSLRYLDRYESEYGLQPLDLKHLYVVDLIETGQYKEARNYTKAALPKRDDRSYYLIGLSWAKEGNLKKAEEYLEQATNEGSVLDKAFFDLAKVKLALGKQKKAIELLKKAIEINPKEEKYYLAFAMIHEREGALDLAISVYEQGLSQRPNSIPFLNNFALLYLKKDDTQKAISYATRALELDSSDANVLDTVGWVYLQMKEFEKAIPYLEEASRKLPDFALFRYHLGLSYYKAGRLGESKSELEIALSKARNAPWASEAKGLLSTISR